MWYTFICTILYTLCTQLTPIRPISLSYYYTTHWYILFNIVLYLLFKMGLGKTVQALSIAYYYRREWPLLIVVPASLRYPWIEEVEKWLPGIHPHDINLIQGGADIELVFTPFTYARRVILGSGTGRC